jgi:hypothetical protein
MSPIMREKQIKQSLMNAERRIEKASKNPPVPAIQMMIIQGSLIPGQRLA